MAHRRGLSRILVVWAVLVSSFLVPPWASAADDVRYDNRLLRISSISINDGTTDGASGDGDGVAECGETIRARVTFSISNYSPRLTLLDPTVTLDVRSRVASLVGGATSTLPDGFHYGQTRTVPGEFTIEIDPGATSGETIYFVVDVASSNNQTFRRHRHIPVMCGVDGSADVDANGDPYNNSYAVPTITMPMYGIPSYSPTWLADRPEYIHEGLDIFEDQMTPVLAAADGIVSGVLWQNDLAHETAIGCCSISIIHDDGWESWYIHLNNDTPLRDDDRGDLNPPDWHLGWVPRLEPGERVEAGDLIGWVGNSGNAKFTPHHLHYELHDPAGNPVDPHVPVLGALRPSSPVVCTTSSGVCRVYGADRYETAVAASQESNPGGAATVYVAVGTNFPDAIAAGPAAAAEDAPILLVRPDALPAVTRSELIRLGPDDIVILGGPSAISGTVVSAIESAVPGAEIHRRWGADRYGTAVETTRGVFGTDVATLYVATGESFADALVAAAAATAEGAPLLLVGPTGLSDEVRGEIERLDPGSIVIVGGSTVVPESVRNQLATLAPVERISGSNRYAVSAAVSESVWPGGASTVYVALGARFPDALSAGPMSRIDGGPLLLVEDTNVNNAVAQELARLQPERIVILGGPAAVSATVWWILGGYYW